MKRRGLRRDEGEEGVELRLQEHEATAGRWSGRRKRDKKEIKKKDKNIKHREREEILDKYKRKRKRRNMGQI